jgi:hypothetical protein
LYDLDSVDAIDARQILDYPPLLSQGKTESDSPENVYLIG